MDLTMHSKQQINEEDKRKMDKLTDFLYGVLQTFQTFTNANTDDYSIFKTEDELSDMLYNRIRSARRLYLYTNRFLQENEFALENCRESLKKLFKNMLKKSKEFANEIPIITLTYKFSNKKKRYFEITVKNLRKFKYIYYERKSFVATSLMVRLPSTDLCRKITDYLY
tara:strand:+ start:155 stop:658 length:504 start_codon:yes stop_codon:yes gene_type:complete